MFQADLTQLEIQANSIEDGALCMKDLKDLS